MIKLNETAIPAEPMKIAIPFPSATNQPMIHRDECKGCGLCAENCPRDILKIGSSLNALGYAPVEVVKSGCIGCGVCFYMCPEPGAISLRRQRKAARADDLPAAAKIS